MNKRFVKYFPILVVSLFALFLCVGQTHASWWDEHHLVPDVGNKKATGDYTLNDMIGIGITVTNMILMLSGSVALLAFVYGGFLMIMSAGNKEWVEKGKASVKAAVIGLLVVLLAYTIVNFIMDKAGFGKGGTGKGGEYGDWNTTK